MNSLVIIFTRNTKPFFYSNIVNFAVFTVSLITNRDKSTCLLYHFYFREFILTVLYESETHWKNNKLLHLPDTAETLSICERKGMENYDEYFFARLVFSPFADLTILFDDLESDNNTSWNISGMHEIHF